jgi:hypothetical protein
VVENWPEGGSSAWINNNVRWLARLAMGWVYELYRKADTSQLASAANEQERPKWS